MSEAIELPEVDLGDGRTVLSYEGGAFYRVRMANGEVQGFPPKAEATPENAIDDIVTNPPAAAASAVMLTPLTVISRMTQEEQAAIFNSNDPAVRIWVGMAGAALEIRTDDPRTTAGFDLLVNKGLLAAHRPAELMAP